MGLKTDWKHGFFMDILILYLIFALDKPSKSIDLLIDLRGPRISYIHMILDHDQ